MWKMLKYENSGFNKITGDWFDYRAGKQEAEKKFAGTGCMVLRSGGNTDFTNGVERSVGRAGKYDKNIS